jgi:hypothetical protein
MAGSPIRRSKRCLQDAISALTQGRQDDARRALNDLMRTINESGLPVPEMPREVAELWVQISEPLPPRRAPLNGSTLLSDRARASLLEAGEIAAQRMLEMLADERMWGFNGVLTIDQQKGWIDMALQRGFGSMAAGAQRVEITAEASAPNQLAIGNTLSMLVRAKQEQMIDVLDVNPDEGEEGEGDKAA